MRDGQFVEVARGDPQRPQTFYPMERFEVARKGDIMAARCTFDGTRTNKTTTIPPLCTSSSWPSYQRLMNYMGGNLGSLIASASSQSQQSHPTY